MSCPRCGQPTPGRPGVDSVSGASTGHAVSNFCTSCGYDLRAAVSTGAALLPPVVRLVACPRCGASNAASRSGCGRCRAALDPSDTPRPVDVAPPPPPPEPLSHAPPSEAEPQAESTRLLLVVTVAAALVVGAVVLTLLGASGVGILPPRGEAAVPQEYTPVDVAVVTASSTLPAAGEVTYEAANLLDGRPDTAWHEGAKGARGEYVELRLAREASVTRLLLWNGYQKGEQFEQNGRVQTLMIEAGGRRFSVDLLNVRGSQAVDLPEPIRTRTIRLTVEAIYEGERYPDTALSEIQVYGRSS